MFADGTPLTRVRASVPSPQSTPRCGATKAHAPFDAGTSSGDEAPEGAVEELSLQTVASDGGGRRSCGTSETIDEVVSSFDASESFNAFPRDMDGLLPCGDPEAAYGLRVAGGIGGRSGVGPTCPRRVPHAICRLCVDSQTAAVGDWASRTISVTSATSEIKKSRRKDGRVSLRCFDTGDERREDMNGVLGVKCRDAWREII